jgi:putative membrane protein
MAETPRNAPRAVRLTPEPEAGAGHPDGSFVAASSGYALVPEAEEIDARTQVDAVPVRRRGIGWLGIFGSAVSGLVLLMAGLWVERTVTDLMRDNPTLGYIALGLAATALLALLVMLARVLRDVLRERRIDGLRAKALALATGGTADEARDLVASLLSLYEARPQVAQGRARMTAALPDLFAPRDLLSVAERTLMHPLDEAAKAEIGKAARQVSLVTAVSPRAIVDVVFVIVASARLLRSIATIYSGRPGFLGMVRLGRSVFTHLIVTGGMAAGDAVIQQVLGQGIAARLSAKLGEGVLNGLLTARVGLAAMALCRPLPFVETRQPTLSDVAGDLVSWRSKDPA